MVKQKKDLEQAKQPYVNQAKELEQQRAVLKNKLDLLSNEG